MVVYIGFIARTTLIINSASNKALKSNIFHSIITQINAIILLIERIIIIVIITRILLYRIIILILMLLRTIHITISITITIIISIFRSDIGTHIFILLFLLLFMATGNASNIFKSLNCCLCKTRGIIFQLLQIHSIIVYISHFKYFFLHFLNLCINILFLQNLLIQFFILLLYIRNIFLTIPKTLAFMNTGKYTIIIFFLLLLLRILLLLLLRRLRSLLLLLLRLQILLLRTISRLL